MKNNLHQGHRSRIRHRFIKEGEENFDSHQLLELLLFYAIPQKDVNPLAHELMNTFGSFSGVLEADYELLLQCPGVKENTAVLLKLIPSLCRRYLMDQNTRYPHFGDMHKLGSYLIGYYTGKTREILVAILLNNRAEMIDKVIISEGTVNMTEASVRNIVDAALKRNAASVVLAHNHPDGTSEPSDADVLMTNEIASLLQKLGIPLTEHFIIAGHRYTGICHYISTGLSLGLDSVKALCMGAPLPTEQQN